MSRQLHYHFEDLPIVIDNGFSAGLVNGSALINYWPDGQWGVSQVYLDGSRRKPARDIAAAIVRGIENFKCWDERDVQLDRASPLNLMILDRLEHEWREQVQDAINHAIEQERKMA